MKKTVQSRRTFFKTGMAAGIAGISTLTHGEAKSKKVKSKGIIKRTLGKTGIKLPVVSMGTGDTNNVKLVQAAMEAGIIHLATSNYYGNGQNEKMVGEAIKGMNRDKVIIATSAEPKPMDHKNGMFLKNTDVEGYVKAFEKGLKVMNVDYVDILYLPFAGKKESVMFEPFLKALARLKKQGKTRFVGIATHNFVVEAIRAAADSRFYDIIMTAYNFRLAKNKKLHDAIDYAAAKGLGIIAMKTMAGAYWDREKQKPINTTAALKWAVQNKNIHSTVPGFTTFDQMQADVAVMRDFRMTPAEKSDLKLVSAKTVARNSLFCLQCGECLGQCRGKLDIPTLMRAYMYAYGHNNMTNAQKTALNSAADTGKCGSCSICQVVCRQGFNIKERILDIQRIKHIPADFLV